MRHHQARGTASSRRRTQRKQEGGDTAPVGSITGQPVQVQISCQQFPCVRLAFRWAAAGPANITNIKPNPTAAEKNKIVNGIFGPAAPLQLPAELDIVACIFNCNCANLRWEPGRRIRFSSP
jgi:hypothetical protein